MTQKIFTILTFILWILLAQSNLAFASYSDGAKAYKKGDFETAFAVWEPLAQKGNANAQFKLGGMFAKGKGVIKNIETAFVWYSKAAFNGHKRAAYNKAFMLTKGMGTPKDEKEAFNIYHRLAANGDVIEAQHAVAVAYAKGAGVRQDFKLAKKWYDKAALSNYITTQIDLSDFLLASSDPEYRLMAIFWIEVACIQGNSKAMKRAQHLYKSGVNKENLMVHYENAIFTWLMGLPSLTLSHCMRVNAVTLHSVLLTSPDIDLA